MMKDTSSTPNEEIELQQKCDLPGNNVGSGEELASQKNEGYWESYTKTPPDGGYGWVIVLSSHFMNFLVIGVSNTYGVFLDEIVVYFQCSVASAGFANSLLCGLLQISGPVVAALVNSYDCRRVGFIGCLIAAAAFVISSFSPNILMFQLTYGLIGGIGFGMMFLPAIAVVGHYFDKKRALANALAQAGGGVGMLVIAPLNKYLLDTVGWGGAHYIIAGLLLQGCIFTALMRPFTAKRWVTPNSKSKLCDEEDNSESDEIDELLSGAASQPEGAENFRTSLLFGSNMMIPPQELGNAASVTNVSKKQYGRLSCLNVFPKPIAKFLANMLDMEILTNKSMIILCAANFFGIIGFYTPLLYAADRAVKVGVDPQHAAMLVALMGIVGTIGRVAPGIAINYIPKLTALMWNNACLLIAGISLLLTPRCFTLPTIIAVVIGNSTTTVAYHSLAPVIICDYLGLEKLNNAFGLVILVRGISTMIGPPIGGMLYDITGNYDATFYLGASCYFISLILHSLLFFKPFKSAKPSKEVI